MNVNMKDTTIITNSGIDHDEQTQPKTYYDYCEMIEGLVYLNTRGDGTQ